MILPPRALVRPITPRTLCISLLASPKPSRSLTAATSSSRHSTRSYSGTGGSRDRIFSARCTADLPTPRMSARPRPVCISATGLRRRRWNSLRDRGGPTATTACGSMTRPSGRGNGCGRWRTPFGTPRPPRSHSPAPVRSWPRRLASCSLPRRRTGNSSSRLGKSQTMRPGGSHSIATTSIGCWRCWRGVIWSREPHSPRSCASVTTCSPIFCRTLRPPWLHPGRARRGARGARVRRSSVATSVVPADVPSNHLLPVRPVVGPPVPDPQCVPDAFAPQDARHFAVVLARRVMLSDREDDVLPLERREPFRIALMAHEIVRVTRVHVGIGVAAGQTFDVVCSRKADDPLHELGIAQSEAQGVVRTEARAGGDEERRWVLGETERDDFVAQVAVIL